MPTLDDHLFAHRTATDRVKGEFLRLARTAPDLAAVDHIRLLAMGRFGHVTNMFRDLNGFRIDLEEVLAGRADELRRKG